MLKSESLPSLFATSFFEKSELLFRSVAHKKRAIRSKTKEWIPKPEKQEEI